MNRSRKDITLMFVIGALLLFAVYNFLIKPQRADLASVRDDVRRVEQDISDANLALRGPVERTPTPPDASSPAVPDDPALAGLLRQLQATADLAGVALAAVDPSALIVNPSGLGGSVQVTISASGAQDSLLQYLEQLRDLERVMVIVQVGIDTPPELPAQLKMTARVFTRQTPLGAATVGAPAQVPGAGT